MKCFIVILILASCGSKPKLAPGWNNISYDSSARWDSPFAGRVVHLADSPVVHEIIDRDMDTSTSQNHMKGWLADTRRLITGSAFIGAGSGSALVDGDWDFAMGYCALDLLMNGNYNIVCKDNGLAIIKDTSFAFLVDYSCPTLQKYPRVKSYLHCIDRMFQGNPRLRMDTAYQIKIHKRLSYLVENTGQGLPVVNSVMSRTGSQKSSMGSIDDASYTNSYNTSYLDSIRFYTGGEAIDSSLIGLPMQQNIHSGAAQNLELIINTSKHHPAPIQFWYLTDSIRQADTVWKNFPEIQVTDSSGRRVAERLNGKWTIIDGPAALDVMVEALKRIQQQHTIQYNHGRQTINP